MDVFEKVKKILCDQLDLEEEQVTEEAEVIEDLGSLEEGMTAEAAPADGDSAAETGETANE